MRDFAHVIEMHFACGICSMYNDCHEVIIVVVVPRAGKAGIAIIIVAPAPCRLARQEREFGGKGRLFPPNSFTRVAQLRSEASPRHARSRGSKAKMRIAAD